MGPSDWTEDPKLSAKLKAAASWFASTATLGDLAVPARGGSAEPELTLRWCSCTHPAVAGETPRQRLVLVQGYTENFMKQIELIKDLYEQLGVDVFAVDHRSQGLSGRVVWPESPDKAPDTQLVWVNSFEDYVEDLLQFVERVVLARHAPRRELLPSMARSTSPIQI